MSFNQQNPYLEPPPGVLRLCNTPEGVFALRTTRTIKPGEIVMVDTPVMVYPSSLSCLSIFCSKCFRVLPSEPLHCAKCREARFCSNQCQESSHHGLLCHALSTLVSGTCTWSDDILFLLYAYSLSDTEILVLLTPNCTNSSLPDESIKKLHSELTSLVPANNVPKHFTCENTDFLIYMKKNNSFSLKSPKDPKYQSSGVAGPRAYGLYLWTAILKHSCAPNVCQFNYVDVLTRNKNTDLEFRAFEEIKEGLVICTSYVGVEKGYKERQHILMDRFGSKCDCRRCKIESQWKENEGAGGVRGEEQEMSEGSDDNDQLLIHDYIKRYICDCGGFLAPTPPSQDNEMEPNCMECNGCGRFTIYEPGDSLNAIYN